MSGTTYDEVIPGRYSAPDFPGLFTLGDSAEEGIGENIGRD